MNSEDWLNIDKYFNLVKENIKTDEALTQKLGFL